MHAMEEKKKEDSLGRVHDPPRSEGCYFGRSI